MSIIRGTLKIFGIGLLIFAILFGSVYLWLKIRPKDCGPWEEKTSFSQRTALMNLAGTLEEKQENGTVYVRLCN